MKKLNCLWGALLALFVFAGCQKDDAVAPTPAPKTDNGIINDSGSAGQGVDYALKDVVLTPNLVVAADQNSTLYVIEEDSVIVAFNNATSVSVGDVLFIDAEGFKAIRKVEGFDVADGVYTIATTDGQLGDLIGEGSIELNVDVAEMTRGMATRAGFDVYRDIIDIHDDLKLGNLTFNPDTYVGMGLRFNIEYKNSILPQTVEMLYKLDMAVNPRLSFEAGYNGKTEFDIADYIPEFLMNLLKEQSFAIEIPINILGLYETSLSANLSIADLQIPTIIETNLNADAVIGFGYNGNLEAGFRLTRSGLSYKKVSIYTNTLTPSLPYDAQVYGELFSNTKIIVTPTFDILGYSPDWISGTLVLGLDTENYGYYKAGSGLALSSKGDFTTALDVSIPDLGIKNFRAINESTPLWETGAMNYIKFCGLSYTNGNVVENSKNSHKVATEFKLSYAYPMFDKGVPAGLKLSFSVYRSNGVLDLIPIQSFSLDLSQAVVADGTITFSANIPYYKSTSIFNKVTLNDNSYIRSLRLTDAEGNVYDIYNTSGNAQGNFYMYRKNTGETAL